MDRFRILSLDGGGIRGLVTVILLQRLEEQVPGWLDKVDLIAGTSTGGLIALGLAKGMKLQDIRALYEEKGAKIFDDSWVDDLVDLGKSIGADYDIAGLEEELQTLFGDTTLGQLEKRVLVTAFDLDNEKAEPTQRSWKPKLFHNCRENDPDNQALARKVGLYTSAAPTYFPSVEGYIDGGVYAPNPSTCALAQALDNRNKGGAASLQSLALLSLGTGISLTHIEQSELDWGYAQWAMPIVNVMFDGCLEIASYQCRQILAERFQRLGPVFPPGTVIPMDAVYRLEDLVSFATDYAGKDFEETVEWLKTVWG